MKSCQETVSIIIPCHNSEHYVGQAIESALRSNVKVQIVVVDDASSDNSVKVLEGYGNQILLIRLEHNSGPSAARNAAIPHLVGKYTVFLDADDTIAPNGLEVMLRAMNGRSDTLVYGSFELWDQSMEKRLVRQIPHAISDAPSDFLKRNIAPNGCFLVPTNVFDSVGLFSEDLIGCEDWDFWLRVAEKGYKFKRIFPLVFRYRRYSGTLSTRPVEELISGMKVICRGYERKYRSDSGNGPLFGSSIERQMQDNLFVFGGAKLGLAALQNNDEAMRKIMSLIPLPSSPPVDDFLKKMNGSIKWNAVSCQDAIKKTRSAILYATQYLVDNHPDIFPYYSTLNMALKPDWTSLFYRPGPKKMMRLVRESIWARRQLNQFPFLYL